MTKSGDAVRGHAVCRSKVDEEYLVLAWNDRLREIEHQRLPLPRRQVTAEDGILYMLARSLENPEDTAQPLGIADVVGHIIPVGHLVWKLR